MALSDNARASLIMSASMAAFVGNDTLMKLAFETVPVAQTIVMRGLVASVILLLLAWRTGAHKFRPSRVDRWPLLLRALGEGGGTASFMLALANMPIANAVAVLQATPLVVTMAAALFLGETLGWRRWSAIGVGFVGMLIIVQPGTEGFDGFAMLAILTVIFITIRDLGTRQMSAATPTLFASVLSAVLVTVGAAFFIPLEGASAVGAWEIALTVGAGIMVLLAYITGVSAMRVGEVGAVAPFRYTVLLWALVLGYFVFNEVPDAMTLLGAAVVTAAGLYTLWREQTVGQSTATEASTRPFDGTRPPPRAG